MKIEQQIPLLEAIFSNRQSTIGAEYQGYRNHVYRVIHFCHALQECHGDESDKIVIAGAFHDIGIWIDNTIDYLPASVGSARKYLQTRKLDTWSPEIGLMITEHHKIRSFNDDTYPLVEVFRKADLVDLSLGLVSFGIPVATIRQVKAAFPNAGFHKNLSKRLVAWVARHPLNPAPMMKW